MSIFPKRLTPGNSVTFHARFPTTSATETLHIPRFPLLRASCRSPDGETFLVSQWQPCIQMRAEDRIDRPVASPPGIRAGNPLLATVDHLMPAGGKPRERLAHELREIASSAHFYHQIVVPAGAALGRWETQLETWLDGHYGESQNAFWVEFIEVQHVTANDDTLRVILHNESPEPTPARMVRADAQEGQVEHRTIVIPGRKTLEIVVDWPKAHLLFAGGTSVIPLGRPGDAYCLRNPAIPWLGDLENRTASLFLGSLALKPEDGVLLQDEAFGIWIQSDGSTLSSEIRTTSNARTYAAMIERELIQELPCNRTLRTAHDDQVCT